MAMLISYEHKFAFIHVPKTGGSSIRRVLIPFAVDPLTMLENRLLNMVGIHVNHFGPYQRKWLRGHDSALTLCQNLPAPVFQDLFKFAFVRNPWDVLVSLYHFIPTRPKHRYREKVARMSFDEFVHEWVGRVNQSHMVCDQNGNLLVDYVGRFERLGDDFDEVLKHIDIEASLGHFNRSKHKDYRQYYSDQLAEYVAAQLSEDITRFGYSFDGHLQDIQYPSRAA